MILSYRAAPRKAGRPACRLRIEQQSAPHPCAALAPRGARPRTRRRPVNRICLQTVCSSGQDDDPAAWSPALVRRPGISTGGRMKAAAAAVCLALVTVLGIAEPAAATARSGSRPAAVQEARTRSAPLRITTRWLAAGTRGLSYLQVLTASGGKAPYRWSA